MTDVIEAMCRAYWNERGSFKWEKELECQRELIRERMRAAVEAQKLWYEDARLAELVAEDEFTIDFVLAPVSDPKPVLFAELPDFYTPEPPTYTNT